MPASDLHLSTLIQLLTFFFQTFFFFSSSIHFPGVFVKDADFSGEENKRKEKNQKEKSPRFFLPKKKETGEKLRLPKCDGILGSSRRGRENPDFRCFAAVVSRAAAIDRKWPPGSGKPRNAALGTI